MRRKKLKKALPGGGVRGIPFDINNGIIFHYWKSICEYSRHL